MDPKSVMSSMSAMMMQTQTVMLMSMFSTLFSSLFSGVITGLIGFLTQRIKAWYDAWTAKSQAQLNSITIQRNKFIDIKHGNHSDPDHKSEDYLQAFLALITEHKQYAASNMTKVIEIGEGGHSGRAEKLARQLKIIPSTTVVIDGFNISYKSSTSNKDQKGEQGEFVTQEASVTISSTKPANEIEAFINKVYKNWVDANFPVEKGNERLISYEQIPNDGQTSIFVPYDIPRNLCPLEELFFDQKDELNRVLALFSSGKIHRLGIMMSGEPGGGKTSLARAIAVKFNMFIVVINLNSVKNDAQLKEIVQGNSLLVRENSNNYHHKIPPRRRIYLLDDADCSSDLLMDREIKAKRNEVMDAVTNVMLNLPTKKEGSDILGTTTTTTHNNRQGLTLKGILDVMDGITPMGGILILNTNRPNDIDSAIKRPGRIDIQLTLSRMTTQNANALIKHLGFETNKLVIPDRLLMGCIVKNLCVFARDQADFEQKLKQEIVIQEELLEKKKQEKEETNQMLDNIEKTRNEKRFGKLSKM